MTVVLALLAVAATACSTTQAEVVPAANESGAVDAQEAPPTEATSTAPVTTSSTTPPSMTTQPAEESAATTESLAEEASEATVAESADAAPPTTLAATDDESAEPASDGFVELEIGASAGRLGGVSTSDDRLVLLVRCLVGQDDIFPTVLVRRQVGDPMSEWTEPASWQYRFDTSEEAVQVADGWMTDPEVQAFTDALARTDATHLHIDTYDTAGTPELEATLGLANKHLAIEAVQSCKDT